MHALVNSHLNISRGSSADPSLRHSSLQYFTLWILATLSNSDSQFNPLNLRRLPGLPYSFHGPETSTRQWAGSTVGLTPFILYLSKISGYHWLIFNVIRTIVPLTLFSGCCFRWESSQSLLLHLGWQWGWSSNLKLVSYSHDLLGHILWSLQWN